MGRTSWPRLATRSSDRTPCCAGTYWASEGSLPRCHALQGWQRGPDRPGQTAPEQRACPGRFPVRRARKDGTRSLLPTLRRGTRNLPKGKTNTLPGGPRDSLAVALPDTDLPAKFKPRGRQLCRRKPFHANVFGNYERVGGQLAGGAGATQTDTLGRAWGPWPGPARQAGTGRRKGRQLLCLTYTTAPSPYSTVFGFKSDLLSAGLSCAVAIAKGKPYAGPFWIAHIRLNVAKVQHADVYPLDTFFDWRKGSGLKNTILE
jgi:hypothetical protein